MVYRCAFFSHRDRNKECAVLISVTFRSGPYLELSHLSPILYRGSHRPLLCCRTGRSALDLSRTVTEVSDPKDNQRLSSCSRSDSRSLLGMAEARWIPTQCSHPHYKRQKRRDVLTRHHLICYGGSNLRVRSLGGVIMMSVPVLELCMLSESS